jgi:hypothetical protein
MARLIGQFMIFGGSYEDTANEAGRRALMSKLLGVDHVWTFTGSMNQDTETEDALDHSAISGIIGRWENEVRASAEEWNERYAAVSVEPEVHDDGDGGLYITTKSIIHLRFDKMILLKDLIRIPRLCMLLII